MSLHCGHGITKGTVMMMMMILLLIIMLILTLFTTSVHPLQNPMLRMSNPTRTIPGTNYKAASIKKKNNIMDMMGKKDQVMITTATIYPNFKIAFGVKDLQFGLATISYGDGLNAQGFDNLVLETTRSLSLEQDLEIAQACGYLEGYLTMQRIYNHFVNINSVSWWNTKENRTLGMPQNIRQFFRDQNTWILQQVAQHLNGTSREDLYWQQVYLIYLQQESLVKGYNDAVRASPHSSAKVLDLIDIQTINSYGDIWDIQAKLAKTDFSNLTPIEMMKYLRTNSHCSALFKLTEDRNDIYFSHTVWWVFSALTRMMKTYTLNFFNPLTKSQTVTFSSYPGSLGSNDDYYQTDRGLVVIETTIGILNNTIYQNTYPQSLLSWFRVMLANRMSSSGPEWYEVFRVNNGGTYNNQWMILDVKKFIPGQNQLEKDLFWVIEQIPGQVLGQDQSNLLSSRGYFASYNVPFYPSIYEKTGFAQYVKNHPETYHYMSYDKCARSEIFRRDQHLVKDLPSMQRMMQYDNYQNDEFSFGNPDWVISARDDLTPNVPNGQKSCGGGYDCKISSISRWNSLFFRSGPAHQYTPVFKFENQCGPQYSHVGLPNEWNFPWVQLDSRV